MNSANIIGANNPFQVNSWNGSRRPSVSRGDMLTAIVTDINNGIYSLQSRDGLSFTADSSVISGNVGDELSFEVLEGRMENGRPTLVLKQLQAYQGIQREATRRAQSTKELFRASGFVSDADSLASEQEEQLDRMRAISAIRRQVVQGRGVGSQIIGTLSAMGLSIDKISFSMLSGIVNDMGIHNARMVSEAQAHAAVSAYQGRGDAQFSNKTEVLEALARHGVPLSNENIQAALNAIETFESSGGITTQAKVYLLREQLPLSVSNIYSGRHLASSGTVTSLSPAELSGLSHAIGEFFAHNNIDNTSENKALAQFMIRHSLDITPDNMSRLAFLTQISEGGTRGQVLDTLALAMSIGKDPLTVPLDMPKPYADAPRLMEYYKELLSGYPDVAHISDENMGTALTMANGDSPRTTLAAIRHVASSFAHGSYHLLNGLPPSDAAKRDLTLTRINLEEIRLKLSFEAALVLSAKGINIDTLSLSDALESVKSARREALQGSFTVFAHTPSEEELTLLERTGEALRGIRPLGPTTLAHLSLLRGHREPNINTILASVNHERAKVGYDEFMTTVNPRLGDSFAKVQNQFAPLLEGMGVKPTSANISAAEILSKSNIPITPEKVEQIKLIDHEVSYVAERLHPVIAASIIREGINPLEMNIRDVIAYINRFNDAFGVSDADKIAGYIARMDRENSLSASEREKVVAFYRVLSRVTRDGSAALGAFHKSGHEPTLGNMLSAAEYHRHTRGSNRSYISQSSAQGLLEDIVNGNSTIRSTLQNPAPQPDLTSYQARELVSLTPPGKLGELLSLMQSPDITLDEALSNLSHKSAQTEAADAQAARLALAQSEARFAQIFDTPPKVINWLQSHGISATPTAIAAMSALMADQYYIGNELDKARRRLNDAVSKSDPGAETRNRTSSETPDESAAATLETALGNSEINGLAGYSPDAMSSALAPFDDLSLLRHAIRIKSAASNLQSGADYTFPIKMHDRIASLNMYVMNAHNLTFATEGRALLALNTGNLGNVFAYATVDNSRLSLEISTDNPDALAFLSQSSDDLPFMLQSALENAGFSAHDISVSFLNTPGEPYPSLEDDMTPRVTLPGYSVGWRA